MKTRQVLSTFTGNRNYLSVFLQDKQKRRGNNYTDTTRTIKERQQLQSPLYIPQNYNLLLPIFNKKVKLNGCQKSRKRLPLQSLYKRGTTFF